MADSPPIYVDTHKGYDFSIHLRQPVAGARYTARMDIHKDGARVVPTIVDDDHSWDTQEQAREAMRKVAWRMIESLIKKGG